MDKFPRTKKWLGQTLTLSRQDDAYVSTYLWITNIHNSHYLEIAFHPNLGWKCGIICGVGLFNDHYYKSEKSARADAVERLRRVQFRINQLMSDI